MNEIDKAKINFKNGKTQLTMNELITDNNRIRSLLNASNTRNENLSLALAKSNEKIKELEKPIINGFVVHLDDDNYVEELTPIKKGMLSKTNILIPTNVRNRLYKLEKSKFILDKEKQQRIMKEMI